MEKLPGGGPAIVPAQKDDERVQNPISYQPSVFYFRQELRAARTRAQAVELGLHLCSELERLKEWVRSEGLIPPKWHLTQSEIDSKNWGETGPWQSLG